ncbi:MAG: DsrE family protein [Deltaproteobacteria bacterium]|nr:DsrE family protein [Deltaproteobacteria bacterium]MBW2051299.1 DsrE family protein [Deltaproteobacteria bacterium]MBW2141344.1 DsrE family protein [Deltaproteobacteria bacterium]MBW2322993.1 DsrE family protein [Deltaproteobacteria bacterium]
MPKTLTIMLLSGAAENEDSIFAVKLTKAALKRGHKVNIFLYGNGVNLSKKETTIQGPLHIAERLLNHIEDTKMGKEMEEVIKMGANIATCHTNEHARGIEACEYIEGVKWGDIGHTFCDFLLTSDVLLALNH